MQQQENRSLLNSYTSSMLRFIGDQSVDAYRLAGTLSINVIPSVPKFAAGYLPEAIQPIATLGSSINTFLGVAPVNAAVLTVQLALAGTAIAAHTAATYLENDTTEEFKASLYKQAEFVAAPYIQKFAPHIPIFDPKNAVHEHSYSSQSEDELEEYYDFADSDEELTNTQSLDEDDAIYYDLDGADEEVEIDDLNFISLDITPSNTTEQIEGDSNQHLSGASLLSSDSDEEIKSNNPNDIVLDIPTSYTPTVDFDSQNTETATNTDRNRLTAFVSSTASKAKESFKSLATSHIPSIQSVLHTSLSYTYDISSYMLSALSSLISRSSNKSSSQEISIV